MLLNRRNFAQAAVAAPLALSVSPTPSLAETASASPSAVFGASLGAYQISAILDGIGPLTSQLFRADTPESLAGTIAASGVGPEQLPAPVTAFLLQSADRTILIDAGLGELELLGPGLGRLEAGLAAIDVTAETVDTVLVTHMHPDHIGGLTKGGQPVFPNAEIIVAEAEAAFWTDPAMMAAAPQEIQGMFQIAQGLTAVYGDNVTRVSDNTEVAPGITLSLLPGHTPGHSALRIDGGDRQLLMVADAVLNADLQTADPTISAVFDIDPDQARQSRIAMFDQVAADNMLIAGSHIHFPGFGRIVRQSDAGFRFAPATWL